MPSSPFLSTDSPNKLPKHTLKSKCIRTFEEADSKLVSTTDTVTYTANAILMFNDDRSKAELYMPNQKESLILDRTGKEGNYIWKKDSLELFAWKGYVVRKNGKIIFHRDYNNE